MSIKFSGLTRIRLNGAIATQKEWKEAAAKATGLTVEEVALGIRAAMVDDFELPADLDKAKAKAIGKITAAARSDFKAAKEMQEAENARRAEEAEALKKRKEEMALAFKAQTENALAVANDFAGNLQNVVSSAVEEYFAIDEGGNFILKDEDNADEAFAAGFASLKSLFDKSRQLGGGFALYEARLAIAAEEKFGNQWPNYFAGTDEGDVRRITRNMKAIKTFTDLGYSVGEIPIGTLLALTEVKYSKDEEVNAATKKKIIEQFLEASKKAGGPINQKDALALVRNATPEKQASTMQKWNYIYVFSDGRIAGSSVHDETVDAALVIDKNQRIVVKKEEGGWEYKAIPSLTGKQAAADAAEIAEAAKPAEAPAPEKPAKKRATKKAKEAEIIDIRTEQPAAPAAPEGDDDDGLGSLSDLLS